MASQQQGVKIKRQHFDNEELISEFFEDISLIGIISPMIYYKFIARLNDAMQMNFSRDHENEIQGPDTCFHVYSFMEPVKLLEHYIITNRQDGKYLLPEAKNIDYIWMLKGGHSRLAFTDFLLSNLNVVPFIDYHFKVDTDKLPSKQNLIL